MVVIKRRPRAQATEGGGFQLPYGDGNSPRTGGASSKNGLWSPGRSFSFPSSKSTTSYKLLIRLFCALGVVSCIASYRASNRATALAANLEGQQMALRIQGEETLATLKDSREGLKNIRQYVDGLKQTQDALYHEIRMVNEMFEAESSSEMPDSPRRGSSDTLVQSWMQHRQDALQHKIHNLKRFIQQESRDQVIERYVIPRASKMANSFRRQRGVIRSFRFSHLLLSTSKLSFLQIRPWSSSCQVHHSLFET